jgi:hypothetical protein
MNGTSDLGKHPGDCTRHKMPKHQKWKINGTINPKNKINMRINSAINPQISNSLKSNDKQIEKN